MKTFAAGLATNYAAGKSTLSHALRITRMDASVYAFTSHDVDDIISGVTYLSNPGLDVTSIVTAASLAVGNLEIKTLNDGEVFTTKDIFNGIWKNAAFTVFRYNHADLTGGIDTLLAGTIGEVTQKLNYIVAELRALPQYLQQQIVAASSRTCRYRLGSTSKYSGGLCMKNVSVTPFTVSGTITSVTSNQVFADSARTEADDYFGEGLITWLTGNNAGATRKIKDFDGDYGVFTLSEKMYGTVQAGDTYTAVAGCRHRWEEDCKGKFSNLVNFGGEKDRLGINALTKGTIPDV